MSPRLVESVEFIVLELVEDWLWSISLCGSPEAPVRGCVPKTVPQGDVVAAPVVLVVPACGVVAPLIDPLELLVAELETVMLFTTCMPEADERAISSARCFSEAVLAVPVSTS